MTRCTGCRFPVLVGILTCPGTISLHGCYKRPDHHAPFATFAQLMPQPSAMAEQQMESVPASSAATTSTAAQSSEALKDPYLVDFDENDPLNPKVRQCFLNLLLSAQRNLFQSVLVDSTKMVFDPGQWPHCAECVRIYFFPFGWPPC